MFALLGLLDDFFANFAFGGVAEASDSMGACLWAWYHFFAIWTLYIVF